MGKLTFVCMVCLIVAASSLTSCYAARGLPRSFPADQISSPETTSSKPNKVNDVTDSTLTESDEGVTNSDLEELSESEELAACMDGAEIGTGELSLKELEVERPCRRVLQRDYGSATTNRNQKDGGGYQQHNHYGGHNQSGNNN